MNKVLIFCIFIITLYSPVTGSPVNLPLDHWAYSFIERMETKGYLDTLAYRTKPYTRGECAEIIIHINSRLTREEIQFSKTELSLFEKLKGEFYDELQKEKIEINTKEKEPHLYTWREKKSMFHWDAYLSEDYRHLPDGDNSDYSSRTTLGSIIRGSLEDKIYFYLDFRNTLIKGEEPQKNYIPSQGLPVGTAGKNTYQDQAVAYLSYKFSWGEFAVGRDFFNWGPGYRGSLALSPYSEVIDMIKISIRFKRFKFTSISGILNSELGKKNIAAHRIEVRLLPNLIFSGYETVIYGNRGLELIYVNPLMPYHIAEHYQQDKDNNTMGFDIIYRPVNNLKIYSELFLDDFNSSKNPFTHYGNKWAFLSGMHYTDPF
ncbi:hypothetical protein KAS50_07505, partial [bacterium]|nr:hypothetical protein [bacterium]